jgi:hypothetical protein
MKMQFALMILQGGPLRIHSNYPVSINFSAPQVIFNLRGADLKSTDRSRPHVLPVHYCLRFLHVGDAFARPWQESARVRRGIPLLSREIIDVDLWSSILAASRRASAQAEQHSGDVDEDPSAGASRRWKACESGL